VSVKIDDTDLQQGPEMCHPWVPRINFIKLCFLKFSLRHEDDLPNLVFCNHDCAIVVLATINIKIIYFFSTHHKVHILYTHHPTRRVKGTSQKMWKFLSQQIGKLQTRKRPRENDEVEESASPSPSRLESSVEPAPPSPVDRGNKRRKLATSSHESIIDEPAVDVPLSRSSSSRRRKAAKAPKSPTPDEEESAGHTETTPNSVRKIKDESDSEEPTLSKVEEPHVTPGANARGGARKRKLAEAVESPVEEKPAIEATPRTTKRRTRTPAKYLADRELSTETPASTTKRSRKPATRFVSVCFTHHINADSLSIYT
jgi:hypothetical protein